MRLVLLKLNGKMLGEVTQISFGDIVHVFMSSLRWQTLESL